MYSNQPNIEKKWKKEVTKTKNYDYATNMENEKLQNLNIRTIIVMNYDYGWAI